jgi:hypothetical protein
MLSSVIRIISEIGRNTGRITTYSAGPGQDTRSTHKTFANHFLKCDNIRYDRLDEHIEDRKVPEPTILSTIQKMPIMMIFL